MQAGILFWSTLSGIILGLFVDATLIGVALFFSAIAPGVRMSQRVGLLATAVLLIIPLVSAVVGFLEGRLKSN